MGTVMQKIKDIKDEMGRMQKNKASAHHLGLLKAKLSKLQRELLTPTSKGGGEAGEVFDVTQSGDSRVGLVAFPSVGKSTLLNKLTGTFFELLDLSDIIEGAKDEKGIGAQVISTARTCNCILIELDALKPTTHKSLIEKELEGFGIRLNKEPPNLSFSRKEKGGINLTSTVANTNLDLETVKAICSEYGIHNADISLRYDATADDLIDVIDGSRVYMPCIYVVNKIDQITPEELEILDKLPHYCPISAQVDDLLEMIWKYLNLTRVYTKLGGRSPDYKNPVILSSKRRSMEEFCTRIDMLKQFDHALVWRHNNPQMVGKEHELEDKDVVQIFKKSNFNIHAAEYRPGSAPAPTFSNSVYDSSHLGRGATSGGLFHHSESFGRGFEPHVFGGVSVPLSSVRYTPSQPPVFNGVPSAPFPFGQPVIGGVPSAPFPFGQPVIGGVPSAPFPFGQPVIGRVPFPSHVFGGVSVPTSSVRPVVELPVVSRGFEQPILGEGAGGRVYGYNLTDFFNIQRADCKNFPVFKFELFLVRTKILRNKFKASILERSTKTPVADLVALVHELCSWKRWEYKA